MLVKDINTKDWSLSATQEGEVVVGYNDLKQCIFNILTTVKRSDPLRPDFGCDVFKYLDKPINRVVPLMNLAIKDAIELYEPRVTLTKIAATISNLSEVSFELLFAVGRGSFGFRINYGKNPIDPSSGNYVVTEDGFFWVDENRNPVVYE
jgi:phage baseplate assembly protein W